MPRSTKQWIGKTDDTKAPPRVRQRIFEKRKGVCHICKLPIKVGESWHLDHILALILGGENREKNLAPAHAHCNLSKSQIEKKEKAKIAKAAQRHSGAKQSTGKLKSKGFDKTTKTPKIDKSAIPPLQRRSLFVAVEG